RKFPNSATTTRKFPNSTTTTTHWVQCDPPEHTVSNQRTFHNNFLKKCNDRSCQYKHRATTKYPCLIWTDNSSTFQVDISRIQKSTGIVQTVQSEQYLTTTLSQLIPRLRQRLD